MGQLRSARGCPICGGENGGKWTCGDCTPQVNTLRELIRNLQSWAALHEAREVDEILIDHATGIEWCLWDVQHLYAQRHRLPQQMRLAIEFCLFENMKEKDAAVRMGVAESNPVAMYATVGLTKIIAMSRSGEVPGYLWDAA